MCKIHQNLILNDNMTLEAVIFDFDGTIFDTKSKIIHCANNVFMNHGYNALTEEKVEKMRAMHAKEAIVSHLNIRWNTLYRWLQIPGMLDEGRALFEKSRDSILPYDGIVPIINQLGETKDILIVSSNRKKTIEHATNKWGLNYDEIHHCVKLFGKGIELRKIIKKRGLQYKKDKIIYVGDEVRDVYACYYAGIGMLAVTWGFNNEEAFRNMGFPKEYTVHSPQEMAKRLREL